MVTGGCLCGAVRFEIEGRLSPVQLCHARRCQRSTGSAFAPELGARADGFRWTRGEENVERYEAPLLREPPPFRKAFCRTCGSPLPVVREESGLVVLLAGVLDEAPGVRVFREIFLADRAPWMPAPDAGTEDGIHRYEGRPPAHEREPRRGGGSA